MSLLQSPLGRFRAISAIEGISYVLLVFIAMPLKYGLDQPQMVKVLGMAHGVLFMAFVAALVLSMMAQRWPLTRAAALLVASMVPFGAVWIERTCAAEQAD